MLQLLRRFSDIRANGFRIPRPPADDASSVAPQPQLPPNVAFQARPLGAPADAPIIQVVSPSRIRQQRIEPEAIVYVEFFEDFGMALRFIQLHGRMKAEFGDKIPMFSVSYAGRRYDDVLEEAASQAVEFLYAVRNPVEVPVIDESSDAINVGVASPAVVQQLLDPESAAALAPTKAAPLLVQEGEFVACGHLPWIDPETGRKGKPSFCVVLHQQGHERKYWGSDLERAIRDVGVLQGDAVRLLKYPKTKVVVGNRVVPKNIWICERL